MFIYLAEIEATDVSGDIPQPLILRLASPPHGYNHPTAPALYLPCIKDVTNITRTVVAPKRTFGAADVSVGTLEVMNTDGALDDWFSYAYGLPARILLGELGMPYDTFVPIIVGRIEQPSGDRNTIVFRFSDRTKELDRFVSPTLYAGNNSGITGREGTVSDIKGEHKIRIFGKVKNITPDPINANNNMFAVNHDLAGALAAIESIDAVRVNGALWTNAGNVSSIAALESSSVTQGSYRTCITSGAFKMGGVWQGAVTCDVTETATEANLRLAHIASILLQEVGVDSEDIDVGALPFVAPWRVGLVVKEQSARECLNMLCGGAEIWYAPNSQGIYQFRRVSFDETTPIAALKSFAYPNVAALGELQLLECEPELSSVAETAIPAWRVSVRYDKRWSVQQKESLAASVNETLKHYYSHEYNIVTIEDAAILELYPDSQSLEFDTVLCDQADATALAERLFALYSVPHQLYNVKAALDQSPSILVGLGDVVTLTYPRFGLGDGKNGRILSEQYDARRAVIAWEIWT